MINAKVTGYWGAGIPFDYGKVVANHKDGYVTVKWDDGREVMHKETSIKVGHHEDGIGIYWGVDKEAIPFSTYW